MDTTLRRSALVLLLTLGIAGTLQAQDFSKVKIHVIPIGENLHWLAGGGGNMILSTGEDGPLLIDTSYTQLADKLKAAIKTVTDKPVRIVINTHWHFDHVGANESLAKDGAIIIAHENTRKCMSEERQLGGLGSTIEPSPAAALPVVTLAKEMTLHWNGDELDILHVAAGHTNGDLIIHFRKANVIHIADDWFNGMYPYMDVRAGGSVDGFIKIIDKVLSLADENTQIMPGHGRLSDAATLKEYRKMLVASRDRVQALVKEGKSREEAIAEKPMKDFDKQYGTGGLDPDTWVGLVYDGLTRDKTAKRPADSPPTEKTDHPKQ